ncbi:acyl transferase/acyl hydrolase/lysophospholipase [Mycena rebaudengoi]|nr:acyl transferase/acyl hydrolase/lysophospholipase [Mycena rebaudengoi]
MAQVARDNNTVKFSRPLCVLSIDGGGIRGIIPLLILREIMDQISVKIGRMARPCEIFDLIGGTSAGGLIALMLGRKGMTVNECITQFKALSKQIFNTNPIGTTRRFLTTTNFYSGDSLEKAVKETIGDRTLMHDDDETSLHCPVFVVAVPAEAVNNGPAASFRTYQSPDSDTISPPSRTTFVWEAGRATSAAPAYFPPVQINGKLYNDGGVGHNNPVYEALREAAYLTSNENPIACLISLGTGMSKNRILKFAGPLAPNIFRLGGLSRSLTALITETEKNHVHMKSTAKHSKFEYYRFNPTLDSLGKEFALDEWKHIDALETKLMAEDGYLRATAIEIAACARTIVSKLIQPRNDSNSPLRAGLAVNRIPESSELHPPQAPSSSTPPSRLDPSIREETIVFKKWWSNTGAYLRDFILH